MIQRYSDHAANERTFLAWVRTAVSVMAFGFLVEKFDLFLKISAPALSEQAPGRSGQMIGNIAGLLLIVLGGAMIGLATIRFRQVGRDIDAKQDRPARGTWADITLVLLLLALGGTLFAYLLYTVVRRM